MTLLGSAEAVPLAVFPDAHIPAHTERLESFARKSRDEVVDGGVGRGADEDGAGDLKVNLEQSHDLSDGFGLSRARGLNTHMSVTYLKLKK